jgi:hypothetical protein
VNVYVVFSGSFVKSVHANEEAARAVAVKSVEIDNPTDTEWREEFPGREELFYKPARSGRWNRSGVYLSEKPVSPTP